MHFRTVSGLMLIAMVLMIPAASAISASPDEIAVPDAAVFVAAGVVVITAMDAEGFVMTDIHEIPTDSTEPDRITERESTITQTSQGFLAKEAISGISGPAAAYTVNAVKINDGAVLPENAKAFGISPSATKYYKEIVTAGTRHQWLDLNWNNPRESLFLTVYAPDAVLGPYSDISDGMNDGRIFLDIKGKTNVTPGDWYFRVQNSRMDPMDYSLNTYMS